ncbi:MAG: FAD-binding oxidoreductase [Bacteroidetes bacterium]|jgi:ferredoxin-NADP reductase|nr:FAD-binding oxidoreductase [Bacteroidota bacterium]
MLQWQTGKVVEILQASPTTKRFFVAVDDTNNFVFEPGQFVTLDLPIHEQKNKRWRSYSIASHPNGTNIIELVIVLLEGGAGTTYLFNEVNVGDTLNLRGPAGVFILPKIMEKDLFFICTGTGVAPFRSMIKHIHNNKISHQNIYLVFGCRTNSDCLYKDEFLELQNSVSNFTYLPCLSRDEDCHHFAKKGYVHNAYTDVINAHKVNNENKPAQFYLCGWKNMIDEAKHRIIELGFDKKDIHLELYG